MGNDVGRFIGSSILLFCSCALSAAAGVGGGGLNVPILMLPYGYSFDTSVIFSDCTLMGNFISQVMVNFPKSHPSNKRRPLIYIELILVLLPAQLAGSNVGSLLAKILPKSVLYILALCVLMFAGMLTFRKGLKLYHKEMGHATPVVAIRESSSDTLSGQGSANPVVSALWQRISGNSAGSQINSAAPSRKNSATSQVEINRASYPVISCDGSKSPIVTMNSNFDGVIFTSPVVINPESSEHSSQYSRAVHASDDSLKDPLDPNSSSETFASSDKSIDYPWFIMSMIILVWVIYLALTIGLALSKVCETAYTAAFVCLYPPLAIASVGGVYISATYQKAHPTSIIDGDFNFSSYDLKPAVFVFLVGILCSLLGIGGGELVGPLLLSMGVLPQVSSATTSAISFFNTMAIVIDKAVANEIDYQVGVILLVIGFCGGYTGRTLGLWFVEKYKRASVLIFSLVCVLILSCIFYVYELTSTSPNFAVKSLCSS